MFGFLVTCPTRDGAAQSSELASGAVLAHLSAITSLDAKLATCIIETASSTAAAAVAAHKVRTKRSGMARAVRAHRRAAQATYKSIQALAQVVNLLHFGRDHGAVADHRAASPHCCSV